MKYKNQTDWENRMAMVRSLELSISASHDKLRNILTKQLFLVYIEGAEAILRMDVSPEIKLKSENLIRRAKEMLAKMS